MFIEVIYLILDSNIFYIDSKIKLCLECFLMRLVIYCFL